MRNDLARFFSMHLIAVGVIAAGFYSLVIYPFQLDDLVKGAIISFMTLALQSVFSEQIASRTGAQQQDAFGAGLTATPTVTTTMGPPPAVTVTPPGAPPPETTTGSTEFDDLPPAPFGGSAT